MNWLEILRLALDSVRAHKLRSSLTVLGVVIGIAAVITVVAVGQGGRVVLMAELQKVGTNLFSIGVNWQEGHPTGTNDFSYRDIGEIKELVPAITALAPVDNGVTVIKGPRGAAQVEVTGTSADYAQAMNIGLARGSFLPPGTGPGRQTVAVLDESLAHQLFGNGDPLGEQVAVGGRLAFVIGLTKEGNGFFGLQSIKQAYVPIGFWQDIFSLQTIQQLLGMADKRQDVKEAMDQAVEIENHIHHTKNRYTATSMEQQMAVATKITGIITLIIGAVAGISLLVGGIGVMNIMLVSTTERTREIGLRMALGARRSNIVAQFLAEAVVLCLLGGIIGVLIGAGGAFLVAKFAKWPPLISPGTVLLAIAFSAAVGIFFGLYPANRAARLNPVDALRRD